MKHYVISIIALVAVATLLFLGAKWWCFLILIFIYLNITFLGVVNIDFNYFLKSYCRSSSSENKTIALTFDDGPTEFTPQFLNLLKQHHAKATFFCIGKQIEKHPDIFNKIIEEGHEIGNHSYSHSNKIGFYSTSKMMKEIEDNDQAILKHGAITTNLYRPPFGITNPNIAKAIKKFKKKSIGWSIRTFDTSAKNDKTIVKRAVKNLKSGSVILMHDTSEKSYLALQQILLHLEKEQLKSVTISQLFKF